MTRGAKRDALPGRRFDGNACGYLGGSTLSRYSWLSNSSLDGMLITRALIPFCLQLLISSKAQRLRCRLCAVGFGDVEQGGIVDIDQVADLLNRYISLMPPLS